ncbi:hypothetical protein HYX16_06045 [Candidatus Woesearchaeota archaeon]|nr:hypothetical protein [Candidatus Woesearchaeota archaeon]
MDEDKLKIIRKKEEIKDLVNIIRECLRLLRINSSPYKKTDGWDTYCSIIPCEDDNDFSGLCPYAGERKVVNSYGNQIRHKCLHE